MGKNAPRIDASVEDVIRACQHLVSQKATLSQEAGKNDERGAEIARACFDQYVEGMADVMDWLGTANLGDTIRTFAQYKVQQIKNTSSPH